MRTNTSLPAYSQVEREKRHGRDDDAELQVHPGLQHVGDAGQGHEADGEGVLIGDAEDGPPRPAHRLHRWQTRNEDRSDGWIDVTDVEDVMSDDGDVWWDTQGRLTDGWI